MPAAASCRRSPAAAQANAEASSLLLRHGKGQGAHAWSADGYALQAEESCAMLMPAVRRPPHASHHPAACSYTTNTRRRVQLEAPTPTSFFLGRSCSQVQGWWEGQQGEAGGGVRRQAPQPATSSPPATMQWHHGPEPLVAQQHSRQSVPDQHPASSCNQAALLCTCEVWPHCSTRKGGGQWRQKGQCIQTCQGEIRAMRSSQHGPAVQLAAPRTFFLRQFTARGCRRA